MLSDWRVSRLKARQMLNATIARAAEQPKGCASQSLKHRDNASTLPFGL